MPTTVESFVREQELLCRELQWIERILRRNGVPTEKARCGNTSVPFWMALHQTLIQAKHPIGCGDCLTWGAGQADQENPSTWRGMSRWPNQMQEVVDCQMVKLTLAVGEGNPVRFYLCGHLINGRTRWVLTMRRPLLSATEPTRGERRVNKPFRLKNDKPRRVTRREAEQAIAHFVGCFLPGYRPVD